MKKMGLKFYRFSISWPRIQPSGKGEPSREGVAFYTRLIDCLKANDIEPLVTLYHWDLPLALQIEEGGWQSPKIVDIFVQYARICFRLFGNRVKHWLTFNEPWCSAWLGYGNGENAPGTVDMDCTKAYLAGHHILLAHAYTVKAYRSDYAAFQNGQIGIVLNVNWHEPKPTKDPDQAKKNAEAAERNMLWDVGWFADPIWMGDYPEVMKQRCGSRLPTFSEEQKSVLGGSSDFLGLNTYTTDYVVDDTEGGEFKSHWGTACTGGLAADMRVRAEIDPAWPVTDMGWPVVPWGFAKLLRWIWDRYRPLGGILVTENGCALEENSKLEAVHDTLRVDYLRRHCAAMWAAMEEGVNVRGYFAWSLLDNFEWALGYSKRFGLVRVDYETMERYPKDSLRWLGETATKNGFEA